MISKLYNVKAGAYPSLGGGILLGCHKEVYQWSIVSALVFLLLSDLQIPRLICAIATWLAAFPFEVNYTTIRIPEDISPSTLIFEEKNLGGGGGSPGGPFLDTALGYRVL